MKIQRCLVFLILLFIAISRAYSQPCTTLGQNPTTAFPVCGTSTFIQNNVPLCGNVVVPAPCVDFLTDKNPFWYRFTCYTAGTLGFRITPNDLTDDYDWQIFDITGHNPNDVYNDPTLFVACNWSGLTGVTGASATGSGLINCGGNAYPLFSSMPVLVLGHEYLLLVSHWTNTQSGYQLSFGGGTAVITDPIPPKLQNATVDCGGQSINVHLNKKMKCSSLAPDRSDFVLSPALGTIAVNTGFGCTNNFDMDSINISFTTPLPPGVYSLSMANGTDGNTLLDNCGTPIPAGSNISFTVPARPPLPGPDNVTFNPPSDCIPVSIVVYFPEAVQCASAALDGSDFTVTGPSPVIVDGIIPVCTGGLTNGFTLHFSAPVAVPGTYTVHIATGSDGNTILGLCNREVSAGSTVQFIVAPLAPIAMGAITIDQCASSTLTLTFTDPINCNSVAANGSDFTITGPSAVTVTGAIPGVCNSGQTNSIIVHLSSPILVPGNYQVVAAVGSDGNTLLGQCKQVPIGNGSTFTIITQPAIPMGTVTPPPCAPQTITLNFTEAVNCNSIAANGSDFIITGPSAVTVSAAAAVICDASGQTTSIRLQLAGAILTGGNYTVQVITGVDGNTLVGQCNRQVAVGSTSPFTLAVQPTLAMGTIPPITGPCPVQSLTIHFTEPILCNSVAPNGSDFIMHGPGFFTTVPIITAYGVNCNTNGETFDITVEFAGPGLAPGFHNLEVVSGTDGNSLVGNCGRQVSTVNNYTVVQVPPLGDVNVGAIQPGCSPSTLTLNVQFPANCNSIAADGSDFMITGPSPVTIISATGDSCNNNSQTTTITIRFSAPITVSGTYTLTVVTGSDGNTLTNPCANPTLPGQTSNFVVPVVPPLPFGTITPPSCAPSSVMINFTDPFDCTSISPNGSEFVVTGPSNVTVIAASGQCNINPNSVLLYVQFAAPITVAGTYQLMVKLGTDGNTIRGDCNRYITVGDFTTFTIPVSFPVVMDSIVPVNCSPSSLKLIFDSPIRCSSIAPNGSDFIVTGPSPVSIASAAGTCDANGLTTSINIQLASPVVVAGSYSVQLVNGADGNTLLSDCYQATPVGSSVSFTAGDTVSAEFQYLVQYDCLDNDNISFSHDGQHNVNQWTWTVNGTTASNAQTFTQSFPAVGQNQVQLTVSNGICSDTYTTSIVLNDKLTVDFKLPDLVCPQDTVTFIDKSTGAINTWQWSFANGNTSAAQNPPAQIYPVTGTETLYAISLMVGTNTGCQVSATKTLKVLATCIIAVPSAFTPNDDGLNDYLYPLNAHKAENLDFKIFNRWGQLLFHSQDWSKKWDGRVGGVMQATGVYIWMLDFTHKDTKQKYSMKGTTTLIR